MEKNETTPVNASDLLRRNKADIIKIWEDRVCECIPAAKEQTNTQLRNSIPGFLDRLSDALSSESHQPITFEEVNDVSQDHGEQRSELKGYSLNQMLKEYHILREVILSILEKNGALPIPERNIILSAIEQGMAEAGSHFIRASRRNDIASSTIVEGIIDYAIIRTDSKGMVLSWNSGAENIFQYKRNEIIGKSASIIFNKEDLAKEDDKREMQTALDKGKAEDKRWHVKKDGSLFFASGIMNPLKDEQGKVFGFVKVLRDDTVKHEAEEALKDSESRIRTLVEAMPQMAFVVESNGRTYLNRQHYEYFGIPYGDLKAWQEKEKEVRHSEDLARVLEAWSDSMRTGKSFEMEYRLKRYDGVYRWHLVRATPVRNEDGHISAWIGTNTDIHEQKLNQERLEAARQELTDFISQAPIPMALLMGPDHRFMIVNPPYEKLTGRNPLNKTVQEAFSKEEAAGFIELLDEVYNTGTPYVGKEAPFNVINDDGKSERHLINIHYYPFKGSDETIKGVLAYVEDVTEQVRVREIIQESEEKFRLIANALPLIIWTATADFHVDWYNDWWYKYLNLPRGTKWDDPETSPMHPEDVVRTRPMVMESVRTGNDFNMEQRFRRGSDGEYRWHLVRGIALRNSEGEIIKWVGANTDIHDQKILVQKLEEEKTLRERFIAALSHDLRTPLTSIKMSAQVIRRSYTQEEKISKLMDRISGSVERVDSMIQDLLDASKLSAGGKLLLNQQKCELSKILHEAIDELIHIHGRIFKLIEETKVNEVNWDCGGIRRILENLCNNAVKYGDPYKPITIKTFDVSSEEICISVHNLGTPIPKEELNFLFEPFRRASNAIPSGHKGWGIGLMLVKGVVDAHKGSISVESDVHKGTSFLVKLPIRVKSD